MEGGLALALVLGSHPGVRLGLLALCPAGSCKLEAHPAQEEALPQAVEALAWRCPLTRRRLVLTLCC